MFLPSSLDRPTPRSNRSLFGEIVDMGGRLISEYPLGTTARRFHFHRRNQLIAAAADAVLVIRARRKSGTMLTARAALDLGVPLFVIPGSPSDPLSGGNALLLENGARRVSGPRQLLGELSAARQVSFSSESASQGAIADGMDPREIEIVNILRAMPQSHHPDSLAVMTGLPIRSLSAALVLLEARGIIGSMDGRYFVCGAGVSTSDPAEALCEENCGKSEC